MLLDECLPRGLKALVHGHEVQTVPEAGWIGKSNGDLLLLAVGRFDVFVTADQGLVYEKNLRRAGLAVILLAAKSNRLQDLKPLVPRLLEVLSGDLERGTVQRIGL